MAKEFGVWLLPGSVYESAAGGGHYNTAPVIDPEGKIVTCYQKMYPWRPREKSLAGDAPCVFEIPGRLRVGLCICYDQWFPEVARQLVWMGADVILNPTMTPTPDRNLELILARANAIANQVYFFSVNGVGDGGNGDSILVDPEGEPMAQADECETVLLAEIDPARVARVRENGTLGLCQVLKSYRDGGFRFPCHVEGPEAGEGFRRLGPIRDPKT
jgi:predicted amidohydrolase